MFICEGVKVINIFNENNYIYIYIYILPQNCDILLILRVKTDTALDFDLFDLYNTYNVIMFGNQRFLIIKVKMANFC